MVVVEDTVAAEGIADREDIVASDTAGDAAHIHLKMLIKSARI